MTSLANAIWASSVRTSGGVLDGLWRFLGEGGPFMYLNGLTAAAALFIAVERFFTLRFRYHLSPGPFLDQVIKLVRQGNVERAKRLCASYRRAPLARVLHAGLMAVGSTERDVGQAIEEAMLTQLPSIQRRIGWLVSFAKLSMLFGLMGTVFRLIGTFQEAAARASVGPFATYLLEGAAGSLHNLAFALCIAGFCFGFHEFLQLYTKRQTQVLQLGSLRIKNLLVRAKAPGLPTQPGAPTPPEVQVS